MSLILRASLTAQNIDFGLNLSGLKVIDNTIFPELIVVDYVRVY